MTSVDLYDFKGNIPDILAVAFPPGMNISTTNIAPNLQKPRPRCDMMFRAITAAPGPRVMTFTKASPNLVPSGAQYTATTGNFYLYQVTGLVSGQTYTYAPGPNEFKFVLQSGLNSQLINPGNFFYNGWTAFLYGSANPVTGPGPFPPIPVTAKISGFSVPNRAIAAYEGDLELDLITEPSADGKSQHASYRSGVRLALELDPLRTAVNLTSSPYQIDFIVCTGASDTIKTEQGFETSKLTYRVQFSIKQDAFNQLAAA